MYLTQLVNKIIVILLCNLYNMNSLGIHTDWLYFFIVENFPMISQKHWGTCTFAQDHTNEFQFDHRDVSV